MEWQARRRKTYDERYPKERPWHWWFAWRPVTVYRRTFWLCWVPRRFVRYTIWGSPTYKAEYAYPEHSICGNVLGEAKGRKHGPNKGYPEGSPIRTLNKSKVSHA
jgi:hypothetical protein